MMGSRAEIHFLISDSSGLWSKESEMNTPTPNRTRRVITGSLQLVRRIGRASLIQHEIRDPASWPLLRLRIGNEGFEIMGTESGHRSGLLKTY